MRRFVLVISFILLLLMSSGGVARAQDFPQPEGFVNDFASILSVEGKANLEARLTQLEKDTSTELAVVTIDTLDFYSMEEYAVELFEAWGIGKKDKDNGVLFIIAIVEREVRIEVGYGLEGIITDGRAGRILDDSVLPYFRVGDYEQGILAGVLALEGYIRDGTPPSALEENPLQGFMDSVGFLFPVIFVLGWISLYIIVFMARSKSVWLGGVWGLVVGIVLGLSLGGLLLIIILPIGIAIVGTLLDILLSRNYRSRVSQGKPTGWVSSWGGFSGGCRSSSSSSSSRSSSGFSGGRSGGGGAGRRW